MSLSNNFYVYEHCRADTGAVFYVGKGCGSRAKNFNNRGRYWNNVASKAGGVIVNKPVDGVDEELAHLAEIELIDAYRRSGFRLANITDGGEGTIYAEAASNYYAASTSDVNRVFWARDSAQGLYGASVSVSLQLNGALRATDATGGTTYAALTTANSTGGAGIFGKMAFAFKPDDFAASLNARTVVTDTSGLVCPTINEARIGWHTDGTYLNGSIKKIAYYPARVTNAQLQALTS